MRVKQAGLVVGVGLSAMAGNLPAQVTPGAVGDTLKKPPVMEQPRTAAPIENQQRTPAPAQAGGKAIPVSRFTFTGNSLFTADQLSAVVASYTGRALTLMDIYDAADKLTAFYVAKGYTLATVNVPAQRIDQGVVNLEVIEGRVASIRVEGNLHYHSDSMLDYVPGVRVGEVYRGTALADGLNTLNELPGLTTRAVLKPGQEFGTTDVVIQAQEKFVQATGTVDNYGRDDIGEFRFTGTTTFNSVFGVEDQLQLLGMVSEHHLLRYGFVAYSIPVDFRGTRLTGSFGEARFDVDTDLPVNIDGENTVGRLQLDHPFLRTKDDRVSGGIGVSMTSADATIEGIPTGGTDLPLLELTGTWLHSWGGGFLSQFNTTLASNFDKADYCDFHPGFAISPTTVCSADKPRDDQAFRVEVDTLHVIPMVHAIQALLRVDGAWSPDPLPDTQQFSIGGPGSVRGYPASEARGDRGVFASLTVRRPFMLGPVNMFGRVFADTGRVFSVDTPDAVNDTESLSSVGLGADARYQRVTAQIDAAWPRDGQSSSDGHDHFRVFGAVSVAF